MLVFASWPHIYERTIAVDVNHGSPLKKGCNRCGRSAMSLSLHHVEWLCDECRAKEWESESDE